MLSQNAYRRRFPFVRVEQATYASQILRPKWKSLYAARKRQSDAALTLPELPDTFFGWMPVLYRVTEEEVLASAGLDAYVVSPS